MKLSVQDRITVYGRLIELMMDEPTTLGPVEGAVKERMRELEPDLMAEEDAKQAMSGERIATITLQVPVTQEGKFIRAGQIRRVERGEGPTSLVEVAWGSAYGRSMAAQSAIATVSPDLMGGHPRGTAAFRYGVQRSEIDLGGLPAAGDWLWVGDQS